MTSLDAQRTLDATVLAIHCAFPSKDSLSARMCETGEPYITICSGGIKAEGDPAKLYQTEREAVLAYGRELMGYAAGVQGRLLWRLRPRLEQGEGGGWTVYSRLIITDRPVDQALLAEMADAGMARQAHRPAA